MDQAISWRVIFDDDSRIQWEDDFVVNGVTKKASIDDIDRSKLAILQTLDSTGAPIHTLTFTAQQRTTRHAVWRHSVGITPTGERVTIGALTGYNELTNGKEVLSIWLVAPDGTTSVVDSPTIQLHPLEVFSATEKQNILNEQAAQNAITATDNAVIAQVLTDQTVTNSDVNSL